MGIKRVAAVCSYLICFQIYRLYRFIFKINKSEEKIVAIQTPAYEGNLLAVANALKEKKDLKLYWIAYADQNFLKTLKKDGWEAYSELNLKKIPLFYNTSLFIGTPGFGTLSVRCFKPGKWVDLDHGIIEKATRIKEKHRFDYIFVTSDFVKSSFLKNGFEKEKIIVTGFPRTDFYFKTNRKKIISNFGLPANKKYVLYAPTWEQESTNLKSFFPKGDIRTNLDCWERFAKKHNLIFLLRPHKMWKNFSEIKQLEDELNSGRYKAIKYVPFKQYPYVEYFLKIADILIADWGGTSTDFAPLKKPIIRLDIPQAYAFGFGDPKDRKGLVVEYSKLFAVLEKIIEKRINYFKIANHNTDKLYGINNKYFDGKSTERVVNFIMEKIL